ncbi:MAG: ATP-binding cassette domain-containing protein, partial [Nitrospirales bacterium]|nr:ATP-binding cassette domain-containing protein [Nitrospirales bacterium]
VEQAMGIFRGLVLGHRFGEVDLRQLRRSIGWVSSSLQERLYATETGLEIVLSGRFATIGLYDEPTTADIEKAEAIMNDLGCLHLAERSYGTLSQGEKQRVLICRGLMASPEILILDEPCTGLDIISRQHLLDSFEQIVRQPSPPTLIYVSHHTEEIMPVFSHILLLRKGEIHSAGRKEDLLTEQNLSDFFGMPVEVEWRSNRAWVRI